MLSRASPYFVQEPVERLQARTVGGERLDPRQQRLDQVVGTPPLGAPAIPRAAAAHGIEPEMIRERMETDTAARLFSSLLLVRACAS